jgi:Xaa-Pro aminopeptidase
LFFGCVPPTAPGDGARDAGAAKRAPSKVALRPVDPGDAGVPDDSLLPGPTTPFPPEVYAARRRRVIDELRTGVAVVFGAPSVEDGEQKPDFFWLTGLVDDDMALVLAAEQRGENQYLFLPSRDPEAEAWTGFRLPLGTALKTRTGFVEVMRKSRLGAILTRLVSRWPTLQFLGPIVGPDDPTPPELDLYQKLASKNPAVSIRPAYDVLPRMRSRHDAAEVALHRKAMEVTGEGLRAAMKRARPGMHEYELKDVIEGAFRAHGSRQLSFPSIVGSGPNAAVLHYGRDDRVIEDGDLVVCDVGASYQHYAADVTRTIPANGRFTPEQRAIYEIVLRAQQAAIDMVRPGAFYREDIHRTAQRVIDEAGYLDYFIHGTSHFIGLEVHDTGIYDEALVPGQIISVEPGIYLPGRRMGVRIEDMVLVTAGGAEVLSSGIPRTVEEIEAAMRR